MLPVQQHDVEVFGVGQLAQLVELLLRIDAVVGRDFRHDAIAVARDSFQRDAEHLVHVAVGFGSLEEADAAVVGVANEPGEFVPGRVALHLAAEAAGAEGEAGDFHAGFAERDPVGGGLRRGGQRGLQRGARQRRRQRSRRSPVFRN